jgi:hypothetical protein
MIYLYYEKISSRSEGLVASSLSKAELELQTSRKCPSFLEASTLFAEECRIASRK